MFEDTNDDDNSSASSTADAAKLKNWPRVDLSSRQSSSCLVSQFRLSDHGAGCCSCRHDASLHTAPTLASALSPPLCSVARRRIQAITTRQKTPTARWRAEIPPSKYRGHGWLSKVGFLGFRFFTKLKPGKVQNLGFWFFFNFHNFFPRKL